MYYLEIKKCFHERLSKFRLENPLEFKELNVRFENTNNRYEVHDSLNAYYNNEKLFELFIPDIDPQARSLPIINMKTSNGSWIPLRFYGECHRSCTNIKNFTFMSDLLLNPKIYGIPEITTTSLLNEKCPEICSIFGIDLSITLITDDDMQLIAKFSIGDSINETI